MTSEAIQELHIARGMFLARCRSSRTIAGAFRSTRHFRFQSTGSVDSTISPVLLKRAQSLAKQHAGLQSHLSAGFDAQLARKATELSSVKTALQQWQSVQESILELEGIIQDASSDSEMRTIAADELKERTDELPELSIFLQNSLIPAHPFAELPCLLEIRPGAGGSEAGIFANDLLRMYQAYGKRHGLRVRLVKIDAEDSQGASDSRISEAILEIEDKGAYNIFKCEAGVHRVQRVPATETKGRTHTSAVAVLVMPSFPDQGGAELGDEDFNNPASDFYIDVTEVRTDIMRARGAGGQHVNTTDSAVRLTHTPTGTVVSMQDSRSQHANRAKAWQLLRAKIAQARREVREEEIAKLRVSAVGVARMGRGDKVRTYNWGQQRVTDHRSGITLHHLDNVMEGGDSLDKIMESVNSWQKDRDIEAMILDEEEAAASKDQGKGSVKKVA